MKNQMTMFDLGEQPIRQAIINVASVPQRSPFRYPGGKTWLIPTVRQWLKQENKIAKGSILKQWNKKQVVALQTSFYNTLPTLPEFDKAESDFAFFLYDLIPDNKTKILSLKLQRVVYTKFASALEQIAKFEAGSISQFTEILQKKLDAKRAGALDIDNLENVVVE